jgi:hypothetical protein
MLSYWHVMPILHLMHFFEECYFNTQRKWICPFWCAIAVRCAIVVWCAIAVRCPIVVCQGLLSKGLLDTILNFSCRYVNSLWLFINYGASKSMWFSTAPAIIFAAAPIVF